MSEHGEMSAPAPQEQPQGHQPDMVVAPKNPPNSEDRPGVAGRLTELKQNPSLLTTLTQPKQEAGATSETSPAFPPMTSVERDGGYDWTKKPKSIDGQFHYPHDARERQALPTIRSQEQWNKMSGSDIDQAIEDGKITDPRALLVLADRDREKALLQARDETDRAVIEERYKPLIEGDRQALANYALDRAQPHLDYCRNRAEVDIAFHRAHPEQTMFNVSYSIKAGAENYQIASHWQDLAAQATADKTGAIQPQPEAEAKQLAEEDRLTNEQQRTLGYLRDHPTQLTTISTLQTMSPDALQSLMDTLEEMKVKEALQDEASPQPAKSEKSSFLIDLLLALILGVKDGIVSAAREIPPDNQQTH